MTAEKIVVNYYYNQPAKVIVHYVEKATGKELEEKQIQKQEKYKVAKLQLKDSIKMNTLQRQKNLSITH